MSNERKTENLLERLLRENGFDEDKIEFQGSSDDEIQRCLPAKKSKKEGGGKPEHIYRLNGDSADLLVVECKKEKSAHSSSDILDEDSKLKAADFAEDGVFHYMKGLRKEFNVIGLAISGTDDLNITTFKATRNGRIERLSNKKILAPSDYLTILRQTEGYGEKSEAEIVFFAKELHEFLRDHMELSESLKPLIVSGILLALKNQMFELSYRAAPDKDQLADGLMMAIQYTLRANKVPDEKIAAMLTGYEFIRVNKAVKEHLLPTIAKIYRHLFYALRPNSSLDLLGNFYGEFLRYSGGDQQGLGIVLTPRHVTELFSDLADLDPRSSIVLDTCTGTGGFLISAMAYMIDKASNDSALIKRIKKEGLVGIELDQHMYTLACANMIFRGDGKANMFWDDCLTPKEPNTELKIAKIRPNVAMLNPPYSKKAKGKHELAFVKKALDMLQVGGVGIAIIPVGALIDDRTECATIKKELLSAHTLTAVMSMPPQLFPGVGTVTAIAVFEAHKPHCRTISKKIEARDEKGEIIVKNGRPLFVDSQVEVPRIETWFGYWRDDGFMLNKGKRVERSLGAWNEIKQEWLSMFRRRSEIKGKSCLQEVTYRDEWLAEAYMETDYSLLTQEHFEKEVRKFTLYNLMCNTPHSTTEDVSNENQ